MTLGNDWETVVLDTDDEGKYVVRVDKLDRFGEVDEHRSFSMNVTTAKKKIESFKGKDPDDPRIGKLEAVLQVLSI